MEKNVKDWFDIAESDLKAARHSLESKDYYVCAFLAQQAAEKALKAVFLNMHKDAPPKIHDLEFLAEKVKAPEEIIMESIKLGRTYLISRYPGTGAEIAPKYFNKKISEEHLKEAEVVIKWCKKMLS